MVLVSLSLAWLSRRLVPATIRCDMLVALGDLYRRHPNVLDPWTTYTFQCLNAEPEPGAFLLHNEGRESCR